MFKISLALSLPSPVDYTSCLIDWNYIRFVSKSWVAMIGLDQSGSTPEAKAGPASLVQWPHFYLEKCLSSVKKEERQSMSRLLQMQHIGKVTEIIHSAGLWPDLLKCRYFFLSFKWVIRFIL